MNVAIIGTGYVGLVTGVCLAAEGHTVLCVDIQQHRIESINRGEAPFYEPGLAELLTSTRASGRFAGTTDLATAVAQAEIVMVAVGTPSADGKIDLSAMEGALRSIGTALAADDRYRTVVIKSTVVPMTTDSFARPILEGASGKRAGDGFGLAMNPEFLREGDAIDDFQQPDRIVLGTLDERAARMLDQLYASFSCPKVHTSLRNAELIKYTSNALLATLVSFSNEVAAICEAVEGCDEKVVMDGLHLDKRLSPMVEGKLVRPHILTYLRAGAGFGGSCLPKDVIALKAFAANHHVDTPLLASVLDVNGARAAKIVGMIREELDGDLRGKTVAVLGLAFKAGTDDLRDSASLKIIDLLLREGAAVRAYDPIAMQFAHNSIDARVTVATDAATTVGGVDAAVLATAWPQFLAWDWAALTATMRRPIVVDSRNAMRSIAWPAGVTYRPIGTAKQSRREVASVG